MPSALGLPPGVPLLRCWNQYGTSPARLANALVRGCFCRVRECRVRGLRSRRGARIMREAHAQDTRAHYAPVRSGVREPFRVLALCAGSFSPAKCACAVCAYAQRAARAISDARLNCARVERLPRRCVRVPLFRVGVWSHARNNDRESAQAARKPHAIRERLMNCFKAQPCVSRERICASAQP